MRALIQRVTKSRVEVNGKVITEINSGFNVLLGVTHEDTEEDARYLSEKLVKLRVFNDLNNKMNLSIQDVSGEILVISQFTLYANCKKGNRPSFTESAGAKIANDLYEYFISYLKDNYNLNIQAGIFGADMKVTILNDGPVTIILDSALRKRK